MKKKQGDNSNFLFLLTVDYKPVICLVNDNTWDIIMH